MIGMDKTSPPVNGHLEGYNVSEDFIRVALEQIDVNALRIALCQLEPSEELEAMHVTKLKYRGGAIIDYVVDEADQAKVRDAALNYFRQGVVEVPPPIPKKEALRLMDLFSDVPLKDSDPGFHIDEGYEELAFDEFPRDVKWINDTPPAGLADWKVIVIGAGLCGIAASIYLKRAGIPFEVIERQSGVGGTWLLNSYPNVRVDSPGYVYQWTFTKKYKWSEYFPAGAEIRKYIEHVATEYGVKDNMKFDREVTSATWDEITSLWTLIVKHRDGTEEVIQCNAIISASGLFSTPNLPEIKGITSFKGPMFHTAQWNHEVDYAGKDIGLIGTGSTGTQLAPALAKDAKKLTIYQRTANWIVGFDGFKAPVSENVHWFCDNMPYYWNWYNYSNFTKGHEFASIQNRDDAWKANGGLVSEKNDAVRKALTEFIHEKLGDRPDLIAKIIPKQAPMVRRMVVDNGFYNAIKQDNVTLVTDSIERVTETGIITKDGKEQNFDILILGAGFKVAQYLFPVDYIGTNGMTLKKSWEKDGARSYLGIVMPNYPNLFMFYGPNHQPRGGSLFSFSEIWARYTVSAIVGMIEKGAKSMEVKKELFDEYNEKLDQGISQIIWDSEGAGYFVNEHGRQGVNMPWTNAEYFPMVREVHFEDFILK
jgi:4-hydroxyacetophenone monooxygenase